MKFQAGDKIKLTNTGFFQALQRAYGYSLDIFIVVSKQYEEEYIVKSIETGRKHQLFENEMQLIRDKPREITWV